MALVLIFIFLCAPVSRGFAQEKAVTIDSLWFNEGELRINFHSDKLFDKSVLDGLERGFTVSITYQIELWMKRNNWFDKSLGRKIIHYRVGYSRFNQRYVWLNETRGFGSEQLKTSSLEKLERKCSVHTAIALADTSELEEDKRYYVLIQGFLEPLSVENIEEMRRWLSGEVEGLDLKDSPEKSPQKITNRLLTFIKNISGFGDRQYRGRSRNFIVTPAKTIHYTGR